MNKLLSILFTALLLAGSTSLKAQAFASEEPTTVDMIEARIDRLQVELADLKAIPASTLTKAEKKSLKKQKRALRSAISREQNVLHRLTRPEPFFNPYGFYGYNYPFSAAYYGYPYRRFPVRRIYVVRPCPAPVRTTNTK